MSKTIAEIYGLKPPGVFTTNKALPITNPDPTLLYGVELEIERCSEDMVVKGMNVTTDGSLRNNGFEFITLPMTYSNLHQVLTTFFYKNKLTANNYSERCSVHVHTNVLDLTGEQLRNLFMLYQVFEGVLFNFIGDNRDKNIFCVPWKETNLSYRLISSLEEEHYYKTGDWLKYTALNILPIQSQGSVEWRHMAGTPNVNRIMTWCRLIGHIYRMSRGNTQQQIQDLVMRLNTTSLYNDVLGTVFQDDANVLRNGDYIALLEDGVLNMKYSIISPKKEKIIKSIYTTARTQNIDELLRQQEEFVARWTLQQTDNRATELQRGDVPQEVLTAMRDAVVRVRRGPAVQVILDDDMPSMPQPVNPEGN
jgi:hypothetical protein